MADHFPLMVSGAKPSGTAEVTAPYDGSVIATIELGDIGVVESALEAAYGLFRDRDAWLTPGWCARSSSTATVIKKRREPRRRCRRAQVGAAP